ncbi:hypothetical protein VZC42_17150 [Raoultella ornithinolytica]|uniref:hypothetical protein n=1 Tax=Raoultella ornithinolytica TaxID=54291 RepID=UPI0038ACA8BD
MIDYKPARKEIQAANQCIEFMKNSKNHDEFEQHWRNFLGHLDKSFNKLLSATNPVKGQFTSHFSSRFMHRRSDQTLVYLFQARNTDFHSTQDIAQLAPSRTTLNPPPGVESHYIKKMEIRNGVVEHYEGDPIIVTFHPSTTRVVQIRNQGKDYPPPSIHLGENLPNNHPTTLAELGVRFYERWIDESSLEFQ